MTTLARRSNDLFSPAVLDALTRGDVTPPRYDMALLCPGSSGALVSKDVQTDSYNCGTCGNVCPTGQVCTAGRCAAAASAGVSDQVLIAGLGTVAQITQYITQAIASGNTAAAQLAQQKLDQISAGQTAEQANRQLGLTTDTTLGLTTGEWVAVGLGTAALVTLGVIVATR